MKKLTVWKEENGPWEGKFETGEREAISRLDLNMIRRTVRNSYRLYMRELRIASGKRTEQVKEKANGS